MSVALLALLALGLLTPLMFTSDDNGASDDPEPTEDDPITELQGDSYTGTSGNDTLDLDPRDGGYNGVLIDAGAGDDLLDLSDRETFGVYETYENALLNSSTVLGGEGDDTIMYIGDSNLIDGGPGNDSINADEFSGGGEIHGGLGDDYIDLTTDSEPGFAHGGAGNDTLTGEGAGGLYGDDGDDHIYVGTAGDPGTGYLMTGHGGTGNDTMVINGSAITNPQEWSPSSVYGDEGSDTFEISFDEGRAELESSVSVTNGVAELDLVNLPDFEPGIDQIEIELEVQNDGYAPTTARIEGSDLIIRYEHASEPIRDVVISTGTTELSFDDITFTGDHIPAILIPTAQAAN
ncbi:hypothetical protein J7443_12080 [Tropicibacter sp. R15_0]|uniref:hypothetical protein n=1 Tax=Tropicibacter sp. R15_0 TaxID=2821101 RepID=UPI001ADCB293|nr:hypothetical protein [Tropicibacter sp. R15_0]MBO9465973.1 hypothetical protein [Tropicibacter sp. R15_0]